METSAGSILVALVHGSLNRDGCISRIVHPIGLFPVAVQGDYEAISWTPDGRVFAVTMTMHSTLWRIQPEK